MLVRISPFDGSKRRHASFAAVAVIPILGEGFTHVQINESDLRIERFRAGGAGRQHVNSTESAVRIVHIPTGVTATCQNERTPVLEKASKSVWELILDNNELGKEISDTVERVFCKLSGQEPPLFPPPSNHEPQVSRDKENKEETKKEEE
ncbi:unnamed protein product [Linum tenue]|uniref:Prokaryotic-type class I peptide chain release factors domain-containing protein n=1 Tax=Linum tenue TaxID=586396 RepID=A0AAV0P0A6_9ROSI|nr:unnamed protein product [Linum tenue]